jgi:hypothetical protein
MENDWVDNLFIAYLNEFKEKLLVFADFVNLRLETHG